MDAEAKEQAGLGPFTARPVGTTGHEILGPDGTVIAWVVDERTAVQIVSLLNLADAVGLV